MIELVGSEKQVKWAEDLRTEFAKYVELAKELVNEIGITKAIEEELEDAGFESIEDAFSTLANQEKASVIIESLKGYKDMTSKERIHLQSYAKGHTESALKNQKTCIVCYAINRLEEIK